MSFILFDILPVSSTVGQSLLLETVHIFAFFVVVILFLAALGLHCSSWDFSTCNEQEPLSCCWTWAQLPHGGILVPRPGIKFMFPALAGGFLTIGPQGSPIFTFCDINFLGGPPALLAILSFSLAVCLCSNCYCLGFPQTSALSSLLHLLYTCFCGNHSHFSSFNFNLSSVQSLSHVWVFATPWTSTHQDSLSITNSPSLLRLMSIESVMPSNHLILCRPLLHWPLIFPSTRVFSNESVLHIRWPKHWSFSFSISPSNEYSGLISFRMDWLDLLAVQGTLKSLLQHHSSKASVQLSL